jgi:hypothetical protein
MRRNVTPSLSSAKANPGAAIPEARPKAEIIAPVKLDRATLTASLVAALRAAPIPLPPLLVPAADEALNLAIEEQLLAPAVAYAIHLVVAIEDHEIMLSDGTALPTTERLTGVQRLAAVVCGIGRGIDLRAALLLAAGHGRLALALDLIGTHALFRLSDQVRALLRDEARKSNLTIGGPLEPGMEGFPLRDQGIVVRLADAEKSGFYVTSSGVAGPGRVLTFAVPMGVNLPPWRPADRCLHCPSREACQRMMMAGDG